jgi:hypothetical protein
MRARVIILVAALWCLAAPSLAAGPLPDAAGSEVTLGAGLELGPATIPHFALGDQRWRAGAVVYRGALPLHGTRCVPVTNRLIVSLGPAFLAVANGADVIGMAGISLSPGGLDLASPVHVALGLEAVADGPLLPGFSLGGMTQIKAPGSALIFGSFILPGAYPAGGGSYY